MEITKVLGMTFRTGPLVITDMHNGGSIFGVVYTQVLAFGVNGEVTLRNEVEADRSHGPGGKEVLDRERWSGSCTFDPDGKHVKCTLVNERTQHEKVIYADFAGADRLIAEVYDEGSEHGRGQVYTRIR
jgi:hypothetical protein